MYRAGSANLRSVVANAKPLSLGLAKSYSSKGELSDGGRIASNPTTYLLPRLCLWTGAVRSRGINPFCSRISASTTPQHIRRLSTMASTKQYRLLCLENPLLGT